MGHAPELCWAARWALRLIAIVNFAERTKTAGGHTLLQVFQNSIAVSEAERIAAKGVQVGGDERSDKPRPHCALVISGIARQTGLPESRVAEILAKYNMTLTRLSEVPSVSGQALAGLIEKVGA